MSYFVVNDDCNGCMSCVENCPADALDTRTNKNELTLLHNMTKCARCATCWRVCPQNAIEFQHLLNNRWDDVVTLKSVNCEVCDEPVLTQKLNQSL
ncbi:indolepyruvate ferredoxin oxidoreductase subunit alpha, partial [Thermodesulfobacteriota bacterium]